MEFGRSESDLYIYVIDFEMKIFAARIPVQFIGTLFQRRPEGHRT